MIDITPLQLILSEALQNEWVLQGHAMTSKVVTDIDYVVKQETNMLVLSGFMYSYGIYQDQGATWSGWPNIRAIQEWVKLRMSITEEKKSKSIAFAIATEFRKHGMPLQSGNRFSATGTRRNWISEAFNREDGRIQETIQQLLFELLNKNTSKFVDKWNKQLNTK